MVKINFSLEKKHILFFVGLVVIVGLGFVLAQIPNPGHPISGIETCDQDKILKMDSLGDGWMCGDDNVGITQIIGGTGISVSGETVSANTAVLQRRVSSCVAGSSIRVIDAEGAVTCETDDVGIISESDPEVGTITDGKWCTGVGTQVVCTLDAPSGGVGTVTSVGTGTGLTGGPITTSGTISIANRGVGTSQLADNSVTTAKITNGAVTTGKTSFTDQNLLTTSSPMFSSLIVNGNVIMGYEINSGTSSGPALQVNAQCSTGKKVIGGGCLATPGVPLMNSIPRDYGNDVYGWFCGWSSETTGVAYAICAKIQ